MKAAKGEGDYDNRCILASNMLRHVMLCYIISYVIISYQILSYHVMSFYKPISVLEPLRERDPTQIQGVERERRIRKREERERREIQHNRTYLYII